MILYYCLILTLPFVTHPLFTANVGGATLTKYLGALVFLVAIGEAAMHQRPPRVLQVGQARTFLVLVGMVVLSYIAHGMGDSGWDAVVTYVSHATFLVATMCLVTSAVRLRRTLVVAMSGIGLAGLYILKEWVSESRHYGAGYRPGAVAGDPNFYTASAICILPFAYYWARHAPSLWGRWQARGCMFLSLAAITLAASRGGMLGVVAAAGVLVAHSAHKIRVAAITGVGVALIVLLSPVSPLQRLMNPSSGDLESSEMRKVMWKSGLRAMATHPLAGVGVGRFREGTLEHMPIYLAQSKSPSLVARDELHLNQAHNAYIELGAELGLPGLLVLFTTFALTFRSLGRARHLAAQSGDTFLEQTSLSLQAGLFGFVVSVVFISGLFLKLIWLLVFLSACLPRIVAAEQPTDEAMHRAA